MKFIAETSRLLLREFIPEDDTFFYEMNNDPEVIKYTHDLPFASIKEAGEFINRYDQYAKYGMGRWAVVLKSELRFIGFCGLKYNAETRITNLGYRYIRNYWGKGYASEAAKASLKYGFNELALDLIIGRAMKENSGSIKVLEKCGMHYWKDFVFENGIPGVCYKVNKSDWK